MKTKGFTLIELLVVVAIIGILAAVGFYTFSDLTINAKINATKSQHIQIKSLIESSYAKCKLNKNSNLLLKTCTNTSDWFCNYGGTIVPPNQKKILCTDSFASASNISYAFVYNFNNEGLKNIYNTDGPILAGIGGFDKKQCCLMQSWDPRPGSTHIWGDNSNNKINIKTNIGDTKGRDVLIIDTVIWPGSGFR